MQSFSYYQKTSFISFIHKILVLSGLFISHNLDILGPISKTVFHLSISEKNWFHLPFSKKMSSSILPFTKFNVYVLSSIVHLPYLLIFLIHETAPTRPSFFISMRFFTHNVLSGVGAALTFLFCFESVFFLRIFIGRSHR